MLLPFIILSLILILSTQGGENFCESSSATVDRKLISFRKRSSRAWFSTDQKKLQRPGVVWSQDFNSQPIFIH